MLMYSVCLTAQAGVHPALYPAGLGWGPRMCISSKFPGGAARRDRRRPFENRHPTVLFTHSVVSES